MGEEKISPLAKSAQEIENMAESVKEIAKNSPEVKEGKISLEDELNEPAFRLFTGITKDVSEVFRDPGIANSFKYLATIIPEEAVAALMNIMAVCMIQSCHRALATYDDLLKEELGKQLNTMIEQMNQNSADVKAFAAVIKVFKSKLSEVSNKVITDEIKKTGDIPSV